MKCRGKPDTTWNFPRSITFPPLHFILYRRKSITFGLGQCTLSTTLAASSVSPKWEEAGVICRCDWRGCPSQPSRSFLRLLYWCCLVEAVHVKVAIRGKVRQTPRCVQYHTASLRGDNLRDVHNTAKSMSVLYITPPSQYPRCASHQSNCFNRVGRVGRKEKCNNTVQ